MWTRVLALFCNVATNSNPEETAFQQTMDDVNRFMAAEHFPRELQSRLRDFLHQQKHVQVGRMTLLAQISIGC